MIEYKIIIKQDTMVGPSPATLDTLESESLDGWEISWIASNWILLKRNIKAVTKKKK